MKKRNLLYILMLGGGLFFSSCNDAVDIVQPGELNDPTKLFRNPTDVRRGVNLIYESIPVASEVGFNAIFTDEVGLGINNGGQGILDGEYTFRMLTGNAFAATEWSSSYYMINRINRTIKIAEDLIKQNPADEDQYKVSLFELYVLRAYANLKLFSYFTPDYTNDKGYSVMKLDYVPNSVNDVEGRATVGEIKQFILDDLEKAKALNVAPRPGGSKAYVNYQMIDAIKIKLFAMTEDYNEIEPLVQQFISNTDFALKNYPNPSQYGDMKKHSQYVQFLDEENVADNQTDVIFKVKVTQNQGSAVISNFYSGRVGRTGAFYEMGRALYNKFDALDETKKGTAATEDRNDVRYYINLHEVGRYGSKVAVNYQQLSQDEYKQQDILLIGKYPGRDNARLKADIPVFRTPDMLLALAEAKAAQGAFMPASTAPDDVIGDYSTVYSILFNIRYFRLINPTKVTTINLPTINSAQEAYKAILDERRVELAYEGQRYLDLKRLGAKAGVAGVDRYSKDCEPTASCNLPIGDYRYTLPIPVSETNANSIIKNGQQNPGY